LDWLSIRDEIHSPYIFSFPHSGLSLTDEMIGSLIPEGVRLLPNMDWYLNELYSFLGNYKANLISTSISRYVVDVNRSPEINLFGQFQSSLIYDCNTWGEEIYDKRPTEAELNERVNKYYFPYHKALDVLVNKCTAKFGRAYVIDLHSFMGPIDCDICLGNVNGQSSSIQFVERLNSSFLENGFETEVNNVFTGGYLTSKYIDNPNVESLQIEIRYTNYLPEKSWETRVAPEIDQVIFEQNQGRLENVFKMAGILG